MAKQAYKGHMVKGRRPYKTIDGAEVYPCFYHGSQVGHSNYMAGILNGNIITDKSGKPIPYKEIQAR